MNKTILMMAAAAGVLALSGCGGGGSSSSDSTIIQIPTSSSSLLSSPTPVPSPTTYFTKLVSASLPNTEVSISFEALNVADINGDGKPDIIMANGGLEGNTLIGSHVNKVPVTSKDNTTTVLLNDGTNRFKQLNTKSTAPTGWVNDFIFKKDPNGGNPYIIGIDHGREVSIDPEQQHQYITKLSIFQYRNGELVDLTNVVPDNVKGFWHHAMQPGDLNGDGIEDFVVTRMNSTGGETFSVFHGDRTSVFKKSNQFNDYALYNASKSIWSVGSVAMVKLGTSAELSFVALPYHTVPEYPEIDATNADIFYYNTGSFSGVSSFTVKTNEVPNKFGYNYVQVADVNGDGLQDIIGIMEACDGSSNQHIIAVMLQNKSKSFDTSFIRSKGSILLGLPNLSDGINDTKFSLVDINNDGNLDIFYGMWFFGKPQFLSQSVYFGDGTGKFAQDLYQADRLFKDITWEGTARTHAADVNNDGLSDLIVLQDSMGQITPIIFLNRGYK
jgi:hypothetical protein